MLGPSLRPFPGCVRACARQCTLAGLSLAGGRASAATQHNSPPAAATYLPCCGRRTFVLLLATLEERPPPTSAVRCAVGGPGPANLAAGAAQAGASPSRRVDSSFLPGPPGSAGPGAARQREGGEQPAEDRQAQRQRGQRPWCAGPAPRRPRVPSLPCSGRQGCGRARISRPGDTIKEHNLLIQALLAFQCRVASFSL